MATTFNKIYHKVASNDYKLVSIIEATMLIIFPLYGCEFLYLSP